MEFVNFEAETPQKQRKNHSPDPYRSINQQLKSLETYKNLCEKRILEIYPDHPLPITESHIGSSNPYISDLQIARNKISKLENQLHSNTLTNFEDFEDSTDEKYSILIREKLQLEESLRAEMLNNEEQRTYIEILKQALEESVSINVKKRESLKNVEESLPESGKNGKSRKSLETGLVEQGKTGNLEWRREIANLRNEVKDLESQVERSKGMIRSKDNELKILFSEKEKLQGQVEDLTRMVKDGKEEVLRLEEEKSALIDYVDEHSQKEIEMQNDLNDLNSLFNQIQQSLSETQMNYDEAKSTAHSQGLKVQALAQDLEKAQSSLKESQRLNSALQEKLSKTSENLSESRQEVISLKQKNETLQSNITTLSSTLSELQTESDSNLIQIETLKKAVLCKEELLFQQKSEVLSKNQEISSIKLINYSLEMEKISKTEEKMQINQSLDLESKKNLKLQEKNIELEGKLKTLELELRQRVQDEKGLRAELFRLERIKAEFEEAKIKIIEFKGRENEYNGLIRELHERNNEVSKEVDKLFDELKRVKEENKGIAERDEVIQKLVNENKFLQKIMEDEKKTMEYFKECLSKDKEMLDLKLKGRIEIEARLEVGNENLKKEVFELEKVVDSLRDEICELQFKVENQEISNLSLKNQVFATSQIVLDHLPISNTFSSIFSNSFISLIQNLASNQNPDTSLLCLFCEEASDQIKFITDINFSLQEEVNNKNIEISHFQIEINSLKSELNSLHHSISSYSSQIESLHHENSSLKSNLNEVINKNQEIQENYIQSNQKLQNYRNNSENSESIIKNLHYENRNFKEKFDQGDTIEAKSFSKNSNKLEDLSVQLQTLERDRLDLQFQLMKIDSQPRGKESIGFKEVSQKLTLCERQIMNYKKYLMGRVETPMRFRNSRGGFR